MSAAYHDFLRTVCDAFARSDAGAIKARLPYYQYNSGLRYGVLGDGEGRTGDPSLLDTWLRGSPARCQLYTPDLAGHGTLLANGWKRQPGGWALVEMDTFNGTWRINDFTFGPRQALYSAMQTSHPILVYRG